MKSVIVGLATIVIGLTGCATTFTGSPYVESGRGGCEAKCKGEGMDVAGMVYMGEYSSACVCQVPGHTASREGLMLGTSAAITGGVAGVEMQRQANERRNHNH